MIAFGLRFNTKLKALSQYAGYDFNSICMFNGVVLLANASGVFTANGNLDGAANIVSYFKTFSTDFGVDKNKNIRSVSLSGVFPKLSLTTVIDNTEKTVYTSLKDATLEQKTVNINTNHADAGKYVGVKVSNIDGSDFSVDGINLVVGVAQKLNYYEAVVGRMKGAMPALGGEQYNIPMLTLASTGG